MPNHKNPRGTVTEAQLLLRRAKHGGEAHNAIESLIYHAKTGDLSARDAIGEYARLGAIGHVRTYATARLVEFMPQGDVLGAERFAELLNDENTRYWAIAGMAKCAGASSYPTLVALALDANNGLADRAQAAKTLAQHSGQPFDRNLPSDPGKWQVTDLRLDELKEWAAMGYPSGSGYLLPPHHAAMDNPQSSLEKTVAALAASLADAREKAFRKEDPASPWNRLVIAAAADIDAIKARWNLPSVYLDFQTRFSPLRVRVHRKRYYNDGLYLYGAAELLSRQVGYACNASGAVLDEWNIGHVVIADHGGDPFVLDLNHAQAGDAPVLTAEHGTGDWKFKRVARSFEEFLKSLLS